MSYNFYMDKPTIGFIGQGWIGKNYADNFETRGYRVVRYGLEAEYQSNKARIGECDVVFIAVPTPTTPKGFDDSSVRAAVGLVGVGKIAVIKSTMLPGTTASIQSQYPDRFIFHLPEFLTRSTVLLDVTKPTHNIVGMPIDSPEHQAKAELVMSILPRSQSELICKAQEAELYKYMRNNFLYTKYMFMNIFYDLAQAVGADWSSLAGLAAKDPWIGPPGLIPVGEHGRGAGGGCHIKDFAAMRSFAQARLLETHELEVLRALENFNKYLLSSTNKDVDILREVYGP